MRKEEPKNVLLYVAIDDELEARALMQITKEYLDSFNYSYNKIFVMFKNEPFEVQEPFLHTKKLPRNLWNTLFDDIYVLGLDVEILTDIQRKVEQTNFVTKDNNETSIAQASDYLFIEYVHNAESASSKQECLQMIDGFLDDLNTGKKKDDKKTLSEIKKGLNILREKICQELNIS